MIDAPGYLQKNSPILDRMIEDWKKANPDDPLTVGAPKAETDADKIARLEAENAKLAASKK